jgi:hypothetical protein
VSTFLGAAELKLSPGFADNEGIKERIASRLERICGRILSGTGVLATIGATASFVGLFGTVWGTMNSFIGISKAHTTNLAVVAPGIAEALLATALGVAAAIPAVVIYYNMFARSIGTIARGSAMPRRRCCGWSAAISNEPSPSRRRGTERAGRRPSREARRCGCSTARVAISVQYACCGKASAGSAWIGSSAVLPSILRPA